jgi:ATP-dependent Clp protease ATP-binding subunit ClpC
MISIESYYKKSPLYSALVLEEYFSPQKRKIIIKITKFLFLLIPIIIILNIFFGQEITTSHSGIDTLIQKLIGVVMVFLGIYIVMQMFEAYFASIYYFEYVAKNKYSPNDNYTFSAGRILRRVEKENLLTGLLKSTGVGKNVLTRLGISGEEIDLLLMKQAEVKKPPVFNTENTSLVKVSDLTNFIYDNYADFRELLTNHGLDKKDLENTVRWVIYNVEDQEYDREWWTREKLSNIPGVATDWSFGRTYLLIKFSRNLLDDEEVNSKAISFSGRERELTQLQSVLARSTGANVILTGLPGQEKMEVIWNLTKKIKNKTVSPNLFNRIPLLFLTSNFTSAITNKDEFVQKLNTIFTEALAAGNVILIIDNLPKLILQARQYELKISEIMEPYLASIDDQIIALADTEYYHSLIEQDQALMSRFETVMTKPLLLDEIINIIAREALMIEKQYEILFTYPAILEIAKSAEYYFPDGVSSDKAKDLLSEISPWAVKRGLESIKKEDVLSYIEEKTNIPVASISKDEKNKLLNLENLLMKRVVAQREAVFAIAGAIRRSRSGIRNEKRPLGSFLFLGPTGVGKTETAKALADVFFGLSSQEDEKLLMRLDMSEYQNDEALSRLIGSKDNNTQGILANMLREHPYGVLLLDEFEKTNNDVLNLFLQIIDEGFFSDAQGKKVMARNIMFIATSNAGAEKIFEIVSAGKDLKKYESEIISDIIKQGTLKPELINRFDATILFHPLTKDNLSEIAKIMLQKVAKKLGEKGIIFSIDKNLIKFLVDGGYNQAFGARPMNRLIQNTIEQHLADLLIRGDLNSGQTISFEVVSVGDIKDCLKPIIT